MMTLRLVFLLLALVMTSGCRPVQPVKRGTLLPSEVYVWQRVWRPEVGMSVVKAKDWVQTYHLLAAEMRFEKGEAKVQRIRVDPAAMEGRRVGLVVRIFGSAAKTGWDERAMKPVVDLMRSLVAEWQGRGLVEVQLDYDCPDSKLADYARLLMAVRTQLSPLKVTCTALPSWLPQKDFPRLAALVPGYVLQVHSLHLPEGRQQAVALVDLAETKLAVERAVKIGVPFRVALPTYSCVVEFNAEGKVREVYAEDVPETLPLSSPSYVVLDADAYGMADLVSHWRAEAPALLESVVWYRLPVVGDRMNWPLEVLEKVMQGTPLKRGWSTSLEVSEAGHREIKIEQTGDAPDDLPPVVRVTWTGGEPLAADGLMGYQVAEMGPGILALKLVNPGRMPRALPGTKLVIGWLRVEGE